MSQLLFSITHSLSTLQKSAILFLISSVSGCSVLQTIILNRVLSRLALKLVRSGKIRNKCYVNEKAVFSADFNRKLTYCFKKRLGFDIADRTADFNKANVSSCVGISVNIALNLVCYVRNNLNGLSAVNALSFVRYNFPINSA